MIGSQNGINPIFDELPLIARSHLERAAQLSGETVRLSASKGGQVEVIASVIGSSENSLLASVGSANSPLLGASSKSLLSGVPDVDVIEFIEKQRSLGTVPETFHQESFLEDLAKIRAHGWARDAGESNPEIRAYGAPIFDAGGTVAASVSIVFIRSKEKIKGDQCRQLVVETANRISEELDRRQLCC